MINKVIVMPRQTADQFIHGLSITNNAKKFCFISLWGDEGPLVMQDKVAKLKQFGCVGMLSMEFWDITPENYDPVVKRFPKAVLFNEEHAKTIVNFLKGMQADVREFPLIVHCAAGISRSGAVGLFTADLCRLDMDKFEKQNPHIMPNPHIYRLLRKEAGLVNDGSAFRVIDNRTVKL